MLSGSRDRTAFNSSPGAVPDSSVHFSQRGSFFSRPVAEFWTRGVPFLFSGVVEKIREKIGLAVTRVYLKITR